MSSVSLKIRNSYAWFSPYAELFKIRLSLLVSFSCVFGYLFAAQAHLDWKSLWMLALGGFLLSGASISWNQIIERKYDKIMLRTRMRPLPTGRISVRKAMGFSFLCILGSIWILWLSTNMLTTLLALLSAFLYVAVYTPLKRIGPIAIFVGAISGAFPPLLGWTACSGRIDYEAWVLFGIQFIWQFPHFWSISWLADEDYKKAGFNLLPSSEGKTRQTAWYILIYTFWLIPISLFPTMIGMVGITSSLIAAGCGLFFFILAIFLLKTGTRRSAQRIMFGSFIYLPVVQISWLLDKL